jgi:DNA-binding transcriptional LysR family regulator
LAKDAWYHSSVHIPWDAVELFLAAAEQRSLSRAAKALGVTQPTVSRKLAELEDAVGEPLFVRSVEGVSLTQVGERLLEPARRMAESHGEWERVASGTSSAPSGIVRVTAPPGIAFELLAPFAAELRTSLPEVRLEVISTPRNVDLVRREADLALRGAKPNSKDLITIASIEEPIGIFAAKSFIATLPKNPTLRDLRFVAWPPSHAELAPNPQLAAMIPDFAPVFAADDFLVQLRAAEAGVGAIVLSERVTRFALPSPLARVDIDVGRMRTGLHLVCARGALAIARVRAVAEKLERELRESARPRRKPHA